MTEITYKINSQNILQLSVSSDKIYPGYREMQNSISYLNGYTEIQGNTDLKPLQDYSFQLNYILKNKYIFTLYANYIDNNFNQLPYQSPERFVLILKTLNFDYSSKLGLNVMIPFRAGSVLDSHDISFNKENVGFYANVDNTFNISFI